MQNIQIFHGGPLMFIVTFKSYSDSASFFMYFVVKLEAKLEAAVQDKLTKQEKLQFFSYYRLSVNVSKLT